MVATALEVLAYSVLFAVGVVQVQEDVETRRVHVLTTQVLTVWVLGLLSVVSLVAGQVDMLIRMWLCALSLWGVFVVLDRVSRGGIGKGDLRLTPVIGAAAGYLSIDSFALGLLLIAVGGFLFAAMALVRHGARAQIPFVPVMYVAVLVAVVVYG